MQQEQGTLLPSRRGVYPNNSQIYSRHQASEEQKAQEGVNLPPFVFEVTFMSQIWRPDPPRSRLQAKSQVMDSP